MYIAIKLYYLIICMSWECAIKNKTHTVDYKTPKTTEKAFWKVNERMNKKTK